MSRVDVEPADSTCRVSVCAAVRLQAACHIFLAQLPLLLLVTMLLGMYAVLITQLPWVSLQV
jgi:hypothetical protein